MLLVHLTTGLVAYSLIFASSTVTDHPLKGAALGILLLIVFLRMSSSIACLTISPHLSRLSRLFQIAATIVRMLSDSWLYFVRLSATAVVMAACAVVSIALLRRFRGDQHWLEAHCHRLASPNRFYIYNVRRSNPTT